MNIETAAGITRDLIEGCDAIPADHPEFGKTHLHQMAIKIIRKEVTGEKAHRWLGWLQACVCIGGGATLEELKRINKDA